MAIPAMAESIAACPDLTMLQRAVGFVTLTNIGITFAVIFGVVCFVVLFGHWLAPLVRLFFRVPKEFWEGLVYLAAIALIIAGWFVSPDVETWTSLIGCLLLGGMLILTAQLHDLESNHQRFFGTLVALWAPVALVYQNSYVGFISVMALMALLGFAGSIIPGFGYIIGFRDKDALERATSAGFLILIAFVLMRMIPNSVPYVHVFEQGALWCGSFVGYLGLLIASSRFYPNRANYAVMQVITIMMGVAAVVVGSVFGIPQLLGIGGTFFALYMLEKPFDIPAESVAGFAFIGLIFSLMSGGGWWWVKNHMDIVQPYLLF